MTDYEGLVHGLNEDTYHRLPGLSSTGAKKILRSPAHYRHYITHPEPPKPEFDLGSAVHTKVLGVGADIAIYPDGDGDEVFEHDGVVLRNVLASNGAVSTKAARAFEADARRRGLIPVKRVQARVVNIMAESVLNDPVARRLMESGDPEVSMFARDPDTGVDGRGRVDWLNQRMLDLKTTSGDASESEFAIHAFRFGYEIQAGHYEHLHHLITGDTLPYLFIVVENHPPYLTGVHRLGEDELRMGRARARRARELYAQCTATGEWPGYTTTSGGPIGILRAPVWNINEYLDKYEGVTA